jgi:Preprotein translocase subunit SecA (ATPase, RNA helicase)
MDRLKIPENEPIESTMVSKAIENAQKRVEGQNFQIRKRLLEFDDVMNKQRQVIYSLRRDILEGINLKDEIKLWLTDVVLYFLDRYAPAEEYQEKWDLEELKKTFKEWLGVDIDIPTDKEWDRKELEEYILKQLEEFYNQKEEKLGSSLMREFERYMTLQVLDNLWKEHLHNLDRLRESVYLRGYAQRDPLVEYKKEAFDLFEDMMFKLKYNTLEYLYKLQVQSEEEIEEERAKKKKKLRKYSKKQRQTFSQKRRKRK